MKSLVDHFGAHPDVFYQKKYGQDVTGKQMDNQTIKLTIYSLSSNDRNWISCVDKGVTVHSGMQDVYESPH